MSELKYILEITPTRHCNRVETKHIRGVICPRCNGQGGFKEETDRDKIVFIPCDMCDGTKRIKAAVTVEWEADYES
jgi:hypothetical protein